MRKRAIKYLLSAVVVAFAMTACGEDEPQMPDEPDVPEKQDPTPEPDPEPKPEPEPDKLTAETAKYKVHQLTITTEGGAPITTKTDYVNCTVTIDSEFDDWDYTGEAGIRGRGNSTWEWYDKKPYRIKLNKKSSLLGLGEGKSWVLLANYRDPTDLMHAYTFALGEACGMPYTNHIRYVEVTLNGQYIGLYQFTEQVQQGKGRVNVDEKTGYLLSLDRDDGPELAPAETDNFWSSIYKMPVCVKNPDEPSASVLNAAKADLGELETAIKNHDYARVKELIDIQTFIDFIMIQEIVYNVELDAPRSMYMHKNQGEKWKMGPLWDFDGGFDFDWSTMYTGHTYFANYRELVLGTQPYNHTGTSYQVPGFFSDLFRVKDFVSDYKSRWKEVKPKVMEAWEEVVKYVDYDAMAREAGRWPIDKNYSTEINKMERWLQNRVTYLDNIVNLYPSGT